MRDRDVPSAEHSEIAMGMIALHFLSQAWEQSSDGMRVVGADGKVLHVNESYCLMVGKSRGEVEGQLFTDVYSAPHRPEMLADLPRLLLAQTPRPRSESELELWNGARVWQETSHSSLRGSDGQPALLSIIRDITERKRLEQALKKIEELQKLVVETTDEGIWTWDLGTNNVFFSARWKTMLGFADEELENRYDVWLNLIHPDDREATFAKLREGCDGNHPDFRFEYRMRSKDGNYLWIDEKGRTTFDSTGAAIRMIGSHADITEWKQAEVALRESEEKFRQMAENIRSALWISEVGPGPVIYVNPACEEIFGISASAFYSRPRAWMDLIHPDDHERVASSIARVIRTKSSEGVSEEFRISLSDGSFRWISGRTFPIRDYTGRVYRLVGVAEDITNRKRMEQVLRDSEERYRLLIHLSPDAIFIQSEGKIAFINEAGAALFGATRAEQLMGMPVMDLIHPSWREGAREHTRRFLPNQKRFPRSEEKYLRLDGTSFDVEVVAAPFHYLNKTAIQVVARDITERKKAEEKIREQAEFLDKATDAIIVHDLKGQIIYWNRGGENLYGWTPEEALGKDLIELLEPREMRQLSEIIPRILAHGNWNGELKQITKHGVQRIVQSSCTLLRNLAGTARSILVINRDVTENKMMEAQLLRSQRLESLGTLAGGVAHDLNNVLTPIMMSVEMLKTSIEDAREIRMLDAIDTAATRGAEIIKQLLAFARGLKGEYVLLQPKHLIKEMDPILKGTFPKSIEIQTNLEKDLWTVQGDATQLHQVLLNLCVNARDAMPEGGRLTIHAQNIILDDQRACIHIDAKPGNYVVITIQDTGSGIPPDVVDKIFDPFFTTKEVGRGTGLGLSTVLTIVKNHGGFITVSSEMNRGSLFKIFIPSTGGTEVEEINREQRAPRGNGGTILIVDDEAAVREILTETLTANGYKALEAKDGAEALAIYARMMADISAVVTDIMMPILDGVATMRALRKINPQVKLVAITGLINETTLQEVANLGIDNILSKPFTADQLLSTLNSAITESGQNFPGA